MMLKSLQKIQRRLNYKVGLKMLQIMNHPNLYNIIYSAQRVVGSGTWQVATPNLDW